jgi:YD repeat-containing protein
VLTHTHKRIGGAANGVTTYGYTGPLLTSRTDAEGNLVTYTYAQDRVASVAVTRGAGDVLTTSFAYNHRHQVTTTTHPGNKTTVNAYDDYGNRTAATDELAHTWTTEYDQLRRKTKDIDPLARQTIYEYDSIGSGGGCCGGAFGGGSHVSSVQSPTGKVVVYEYNLALQKTAEKVGFGSMDEALTSYIYNANDGSLERITDPRGFFTDFTYDSRKRRITSKNYLGGTSGVHLTTQWTYDAAGNNLSVQRPVTGSSGGLTTNVYDVMNRVTSTTDPAGQTTSFGYGRVAAGDGGDTMRSLTDATAKSYTFASDKLGRRTTMVYPPATPGGSGPQESWTFDGAGNMKTFTNRGGAVLTNTFDNRNRVTLANWSDTTPDVATGYDDAGRVTSQANGVSVLTYAYNPANELTQETQDIGNIVINPYGGSGSSFNPPAMIVAMTYDNDGNRATMTYPDGTALAFGYTGRNQLDTITSGGAEVVNYEYYANGIRKVRNMAAGTAAASFDHNSGVDEVGRVGRLTMGFGASLSRLRQRREPHVAHAEHLLAGRHQTGSIHAHGG